MSGYSFLTDRCDVLRRGKTTQAYGSKPAYGNHLTGVPCRLKTKKQSGFNSITAEFVTTTLYTLEVMCGVDIQEGDQITNMTLERDRDEEAYTGTFQVDGGVMPSRGRVHRIQQVSLKRVS